MIGAIVLAAGESRRMGTQKLLLPFGESTVIGHIVREVRGSRVDRVVVVTGHDQAGVVSELDGCDVEFAHNTDYRSGMLSSIRRGLAALPTELSAFVIVLGDQPSVTSVIIDSLIDAYQKRTHDIVIPSHAGSNGHPAMISGKYRNEIMTSFDDVGLRGLLHSRPEAVLRIPISDNGVLFDIDTPEDYKRELRRAQNSARGERGAEE